MGARSYESGKCGRSCEIDRIGLFVHSHHSTSTYQKYGKYMIFTRGRPASFPGALAPFFRWVAAHRTQRQSAPSECCLRAAFPRRKATPSTIPAATSVETSARVFQNLNFRGARPKAPAPWSSRRQTPSGRCFWRPSRPGAGVLRPDRPKALDLPPAGRVQDVPLARPPARPAVPR